MAVDANTYGTVARVEALVRDIPDGGTFSTSTTPKLAEVEQFLDDVADEINEALRAAGYTVPVASSSPDVEANGRLVRVNTFGAAATVVGMYPPQAFNPDNPDLKNRMDFFEGRLTKLLEDIREGKLSATRTTGKLKRTFSGSQEDKDGNEKLPVFTRDITDYPGAHVRTGT